MKLDKIPKTAHTASTQYGRGDYYGSGKRNPMGKVLDGLGQKTLTAKKLQKPPKKLA